MKGFAHGSVPYQIMCGSEKVDITVSSHEELLTFGGCVRLVFDTTDIKIYSMLDALSILTTNFQTPLLFSWSATSSKDRPNFYTGMLLFKKDNFDTYFKAMPFKPTNQNISVGYDIKPKKPRCDCGAVKCGHSNVPGPSHSNWCDLMKQTGALG